MIIGSAGIVKRFWVGKDDGGNRWIICDKCEGKYHLQCSGIEYEEEEYDDLDLNNEIFYCDNCEE